MRIGMIFSTPLPPREGIGFYAWNLAKELTRLGHKVTLITRGGFRRTTREEKDGIFIYRPPFFPLYPFHVHLHGIFLKHLIDKMEGDLDLLHLHTPLVQLPSTNLPTVVTFHNPMKADIASISEKSLIGLLSKAQLPVTVSLENEMLRKANILTTVATSVATELGEYGVNPTDVRVLGNGVDTQVFCPGEKTKIISGHKYFFTAGRLGPRKGLEILLACARIVIKNREDVEFWIAGDGPYKRQLKGIAKSLGLNSNVRFLGHISDRSEMVKLYRGAIGFVHPAHYEGLPTVLLEAMACGCPVIATAVSGALDVVENEKNGLLVAPRNPEAMAEKVIALLDSHSMQQKLGEAGASTIRKKYSWKAISAKYLELYESLGSHNSPNIDYHR